MEVLCYNTGKELDPETGLYYYGARYLDPRVSRWLSGDPALGEYVPAAPVNEEARKRNGNLPGMGGVFNCVNLHAYHYTGNNPVKYTDPDGEWFIIDDFIVAIYLKIKDKRSESIWDLILMSFKHSFQHPVVHGKFLYAIYESLKDITLSLGENVEINLYTDTDEDEFRITIRNKKRNPNYPDDEEVSKQLDEQIEKVKREQNEKS